MGSGSAAQGSKASGEAKGMGRMAYFIPRDRSSLDAEAGFRVAIAIEGEAGYYLTGANDWRENPRAVRPYFYGHDFDKAVATCDEVNAQRGISVTDREEIIHSTIDAQIREEDGGRRKRSR